MKTLVKELVLEHKGTFGNSNEGLDDTGEKGIAVRRCCGQNMEGTKRQRSMNKEKAEIAGFVKGHRKVQSLMRSMSTNKHLQKLMEKNRIS